LNILERKENLDLTDIGLTRIESYSDEIQQALNDNEENTNFKKLRKEYITNIKQRITEQQQNIEKNRLLLKEFLRQFQFSQQEENEVFEKQKRILKDIYPATLDIFLQLA